MPAITPRPTTDLCDENETRADAITVVAPLFKNFGGAIAFAGQIATVRCADDNSKVRDMVSSEGDGRVLVVDGGASKRCALLGGNLAVMAADNGWSGILINGCVRDADELAAVAIGIRALATMPRRSEKRQTGSVNIPVNFADAAFLPGHYLYADRDGIVLSADPL